MKSFLEIVAQDLYKKLGDKLSSTAIVFPNKRAGLFFNEYLAAQSDKPIWAPNYISISELFRDLSTLKIADPILLVCILYRIYCEETKSKETLDEFYFWGELLISDFDDVDKNMVDAERLFCNLRDLKSIMADNDYLTPEQEEAIQLFFTNFSIEKRSELKERFISLWDKLGEIYHHFRNELQKRGIAYEGMMYRDVMDKLEVDKLPYDHYVFVGFNVLNRVETTLFKQLQESGKALFYWDYDNYYTEVSKQYKIPYSNEAGEFINRNMKVFPNQLPTDCFDNIKLKKKIEYISSPTENGQARFLPQWIRQHINPETGKEKETAVVLCNETLLLPVLHSIPQEVQHINITMGFPMAETPINSFINALTELHTEGYQLDANQYKSEYVLAVLKHPYTRQLSSLADSVVAYITEKNRFYPTPAEIQKDEFLKKLFTPQTNLLNLCIYLNNSLQEVTKLYAGQPTDEENKQDVFDQLYRESLFKGYTIITRLQSLIEEGELKDIRYSTFKHLLYKLLSSATIPFHGEPAIGMQIMGVLETRNLDFKNLVMLSVNEGQLPKKEGDSSFIPYNLRKAFGMTTIEHKNSVYAYYFYRLIQRAEHITLLYNTSSDGLNRGEMSRFMLQMLVELPQPIQTYYLEAGQRQMEERAICIEKNEEIKNILIRKFGESNRSKRLLSPTAINTYLDCKLRFYFRYVANIHEPDEVSTEIGSRMFGQIFHRSAEIAYQELTARNKTILKEDLSQLLNNDVRIEEYVNRAFKELFFQLDKNEHPIYNGTQLIHAKVIASYLKQLLRLDLAYAPFSMEGMEKPIDEVFTIKSNGAPLSIRIGGTIDRLDSKGDVLRIVDYKTGGQPKQLQDLEQLFTPAEEHPKYILQTFLYASIMCKAEKRKVSPAVLYIHRAANSDYSPIIHMGLPRAQSPVDNFSELDAEFRERLEILLDEIFNSDVPFSQTEIRSKCTYCEYRNICRITHP